MTTDARRAQTTRGLPEGAPRRGRGPRGEYAKSEGTRRAILDAALDVFAESGFRAGSIREVATRVEMSEAGLLHHFRSKTALLQAVLDHREEQSRAILNFDAPDGLETLHGLVTLTVHNASTPGVVELYCTLSAEAISPDHPAHEYFARRYSQGRDRLAQAFERIAAMGRLAHGVVPYRAAVATIALMDGLQLQWLLDPSSTDMAESLREFLARLVLDFGSSAEAED